MSISYDRPVRRVPGHWQDWVTLVLGLFLFVSPWLLAFARPHGVGGAAAASNASWDSWIMGAVIVLVAAIAILRHERWAEWVALGLGIWLFVAPFVLGFVPVTGAALTHWIVGAVVAICAMWELREFGVAPLHVLRP